MREIKFRAWYDGNMYFVNELMFNSTGVYIATLVNTEIMQMYHYQTNDIRTIELMQYTGLKDKNGQEVYEGDIIRAEEEGLGVIKYGVGCFYYEDDWNGRIALEELTDLMVVVGNIYEHAHLLPEDDFEHKTNQQ